MKRITTLGCKLLPLLALTLALASPARAWWNNSWTVRKALTVENPLSGAAPLQDVPVLIRLHAADFDFAAARDDGGDLRFVAGDDQTLLPFQIAQYDSLLSEAFVWVKIPTVKAGEPMKFWLYYGNPTAPAAADGRTGYDAAPARGGAMSRTP